MSLIGLDSNVLAYLVGVRRTPRDDDKIARSRAILDLLGDDHALVAPVQALGELFVVLRRHGVSSEDSIERVSEIAATFEKTPSLPSTLETALSFVADHRLQFWDSMILAAALEAGCSLLLSEDMQDGFALRGLTVVNPLLDKPHRALARLLPR